MTNRSPNRYINSYVFGPQQKLFEDLIVEAIQIHGFWINYMPKTKVNLDLLFGESTAATFENAVIIEAYTKNNEGFDGQRLMSKFGIEIQDEVILTIAQRRFEEVRAEHLEDEEGFVFDQEVTSRYGPKQFNGILLEEGSIEGYYIDYSRPREGDLIFIPIFNKVFEISFVKHDAIFYQGGKLQTYDLYCNLFQYSSEEFNTGVPAIDSIEDLFSGDVLKYNMLEEDGDSIGTEDDGNLIEENDVPDSVDGQANNHLITTLADDVVDFSEKSPFVRRNENEKW